MRSRHASSLAQPQQRLARHRPLQITYSSQLERACAAGEPGAVKSMYGLALTFHPDKAIRHCRRRPLLPGGSVAARL
jgi:hypothetical protein